MRRNSRSRQRGQTLVMAAGAMVPILIMCGLIIDGGYVFTHQRRTQNGIDAAAEAGAIVLVQNLPLRNAGQPQPMTDTDVKAAVDAAAADNGLSAAPNALYTDISGNPVPGLLPVGSYGGTPPPDTAYGVQAEGSTQVGTFFSRVAGFTGFTTTAKATAVAGAIQEICAASQACGFIPVTFPTQLTLCDGSNKQVNFGTSGPYGITTTPTSANESIIPLCSTTAGSVGWLDVQPDNPACTGTGTKDLACDIAAPANQTLQLPIWIHSTTGNTNSVQVQNALNTYSGSQVGVYEPGADKIVQIPLYDCISNSVGQLQPGPPCPSPPETGTGSLTYYHIVAVAAVILDRSYIQTSNPECNQAPGGPPVGGNGGTGCLKGWITQISTSGTVGLPNPGTPNTVWGIQLVR